MEHTPDALLKVLIVDGRFEGKQTPSGIQFYSYSDYPELQIPASDSKDHLRWSLKPVFLKFLLGDHEKVLFVDPDVFFFGNSDFLFDLLDDNNVLLTPHWESFDPNVNPNGFVRNIKNGFFNAGFVGVSRSGIPAIEWWSKMCIFKCEIDPWNGVYVDQGYLSLIPAYFDNVKIIQHKGCNVADWNIDQNERSIDERGEVRVADYPIVFIHFAADTIKDILDGEDGLLLPYYRKYQSVLSSFKSYL